MSIERYFLIIAMQTAFNVSIEFLYNHFFRRTLYWNSWESNCHSLQSSSSIFQDLLCLHTIKDMANAKIQCHMSTMSAMIASSCSIFRLVQMLLAQKAKVCHDSPLQMSQIFRKMPTAIDKHEQTNHLWFPSWPFFSFNFFSWRINLLGHLAKWEFKIFGWFVIT